MCSFATRPSRQRGAATLLLSAVILFTISTAAVIAARSAVTDLRTIHNYALAQQAREAADGALERGLNSLTWDLVATGSDTGYTLIGGAWSTYSGNPAKLVSTSYAHFRLLTAGDFTQVEVRATGIASDNQTQRQVFALARFVKNISYTSPGALTVRGNVTATASVNLTNTVQDVGIWAGGTLTGSPTVTVSVGAGDGIYTNDANLAALSPDGFFENFFSESKTFIRARATQVNCATPCSASTPEIQALNSTGGLIWIDGDLTLDTPFAFGTTTDPVILVVTGNLTLNNPSAEIFGQLYVAGDWLNGAGGGRITGLAMVENNFDASGSLQIDYDATVLALTDKLGAYAKVPGSWRDF